MKCVICYDEAMPNSHVCSVCIDAPLYKNPCKPDCAYRTDTCHSECERYLTWKFYRKRRNKKKLLISKLFGGTQR